MRRVLITGAYGFLGRHTANYFKKMGFEVIGLGHGNWGGERPQSYGINQWIEASIDFPTLKKIEGKIDCVVHCAGGSSVGYSFENPLTDFTKTVNSSITILEYLRRSHPAAVFVYPSSAAVYGNVEDKQIIEEQEVCPISTYGYYKKLVEDLCFLYATNYKIQTKIIRFFSIYGEGLKKQLLWDACKKISENRGGKAEFFGDGQETRDWIHVSDAVRLIYCIFSNNNSIWEVVNGAYGERFTNEYILRLVECEYADNVEIRFNNVCKSGDPKYYWADISKSKKLNWEPKIELTLGVKKYVEWFKKNRAPH